MSGVSVELKLLTCLRKRVALEPLDAGNKGTRAVILEPLIRQAGSAEAFVGSAATGREHSYFDGGRANCQVDGVTCLVIKTHRLRCE